MTLTIDAAGRVVIPKPLRDKLGLQAGSALEVLETPEGVTLKPTGLRSALGRKGRFLVITSKLPPGFDILKAIDEEREAQDRKNLGY
jgi:AbrB family looped-hinge helix DNA binding protein